MRVYQRKLPYKPILLLTAVVCALLIAVCSYFSRDIGGDDAFAAEHPLYISEIMSRNLSFPNSDGVCCDWIEIGNRSDRDINISGYHLSDDYTGAKYAFPLGTVIKAEGYLLVYCSSEYSGGRYAPFALNRRGGENIVLTNGNNLIIDRVTTLNARRNYSMIRLEDGSLSLSLTPTPGYANNREGYESYLADVRGGGSGVRLSEVMTSNHVYADGSGVFCDWIELMNTSGQSVSLAGYGLSDTDTAVKYVFPEGTELPAGGYLVVSCSADLPGAAPFALRSDGGDAVVLYDAAGTPADRLELPAIPADHSLALTDEGWTLCSAATPGYANSGEGFTALCAARGCAAEGAVISRVMAGSGGETDWIELYNASQARMTLLGWYLSDDAEKPFAWALPDVRLEPGETLRILADGGDSREGEICIDFRLSSGDTVLLTSPAQEIASRVSCFLAGENGLLIRAADGSYAPGQD